MLLQGQVGAPPVSSLSDGNQYNLLQGKSQELIVSELHGKYASQNWRGNLWLTSLTTASAIPAFATNATPNFILWNPAGNTKALSLVKVNLAYVAGTYSAGAIGWSKIVPAGNALGTAAPMSTFTALTVQGAQVGLPYNGNVQAGSAATVTGTGLSAAAVHRWLKLGGGAPAVATAAFWPGLGEDYDGDFIVPPNTAIFLHATQATTATFQITAVWEEIPWP